MLSCVSIACKRAQGILESEVGNNIADTTWWLIHEEVPDETKAYALDIWTLLVQNVTDIVWFRLALHSGSLTNEQVKNNYNKPHAGYKESCKKLYKLVL